MESAGAEDIAGGLAGQLSAHLQGLASAPGASPLRAADLVRVFLHLGIVKDLLIATAAYIAQSTLSVASPAIVFALLQWFEDPAAPLGWGLFVLALKAAAILGQSPLAWVHHQHSARAGLRSFVAVAGAAFRRALHLNSSQLSRFKSGELTMLVASDIENLLELWTGIVDLAIQPIEICAIVCLLWIIVAESSLVALVLVFLSYAASKAFTNAMERYSTAKSAVSDERLKVLVEVLYGMKVVKANGWVPRFQQRLRALGHQESRFMLRKKVQFGGIMLCSCEFVDMMSFCVVSFAIFVAGVEIRASRLFTVWIFMSVLHGKIFSFPNVLRSVSTVWSSLRRCATFFESHLELRSAGGEELPPALSDDGEKVIQVSGVQFSYVDYDRSKLEEAGTTSLTTVLRGVDLELRSGHFYAVVGPVGAGKTSLLLGLMGEMHTGVGGSVRRSGAARSMAYVPQDPVIFSGTVRENICFGLPYRVEHYTAVCKACALWHDFGLLPQGDATMLGSRGVKVSGGQQARICLARAVYSGAQAYLLDDPLAKLDTRVNAAVFKDVLHGFLGGCLRIMVTTSAQVAQQCDAIITVDHGAATIVEPAAANLIQVVPPAAECVEGDNGSAAVESDLQIEEDPAEIEKQLEALLPAGDGDGGSASGIRFFLTQYAAGLGSPRWACLYLMLVLLEVVIIELGMYTLVWVTEDPDDEHHSPAWYLTLYGLCIVGEYLIASAIYALLAVLTQRAVERLHEALLHSVLHASLMWLQDVPVGQILQLFSFALGCIEEKAFEATAFGTICFVFLGVSCLMMCTAFPPFIVILLFLVVTLYWLSNSAERCAPDVRATNASLQKACLQEFTEMLAGHVPVRVFGGAADFFCRRFEALLDRRRWSQASSTSLDNLSIMRVSFAGSIMYVAAAATMVVGRELVNISPGLAGFLLTNSCYFGILVGVVKEKSTTLSEVARERSLLQRLIRCIPMEVNEEHGPDSAELAQHAGWPSRGLLEIARIEVRYKPELPPALRDFSLCIEPGQHVGVVGRTGSGKSSLLLGLARLVEVTGGKIVLDGIDLSRVGLQEMRPHMGMLSQDPLFFSGSLRENLDPFTEYADKALWSALTDVGLAHLFAPGGGGAGLATLVAELGGNFSTGQRQLLCLARAVLRHPRVLLVDEATASLDSVADARVQEVLQDRFSRQGVSVLQVAHRLWSVIHCDLVAVLEDGRLADLGTPAELASREGGPFRAFLERLGPEEAQALCERAATGGARSVEYGAEVVQWHDIVLENASSDEGLNGLRGNGQISSLACFQGAWICK